MASTGAILRFRPRAVTVTSPNRHTGASIFVPVRLLSGVFTSVGVDAGRDLQNLRAFLPNKGVQVLMDDGTMSMPWYRFFQKSVDVFLGGAGTLTIADIISAVTTSQENATQQALLTAAIAQQSQSTAEAVSVVRQVAVNNSLTGADQIPPVQLSYSMEP